jgi:chromate transporter
MALALVAVSSALGVLSASSSVYILIGAGVIGVLVRRDRIVGTALDSAAGTKPAAHDGRVTLSGFAGMLFVLAPSATGVTLLALALTFFKVGLIFFGGGFVLVPLLYQRLVMELAWLRPQEFLDGVAISNLTPGPISVLATFIGYKFQGISGALVATAGLYLPASVLMFVLSYGYGRLRGRARLQDFLAGVAPALVGLILSAAVLLGRGALASWQAALFAILATLLLGRLRWPPAIVLALGALFGVLRLVP